MIATAKKVRLKFGASSHS